MPDTMELQDMKKMTIDEKQRELFKVSAAQIESQAKQVIAGIKDLATCDDAVAWCVDKKDMIKKIEEGELGMARAFWYKKWNDQNLEIKGFITPLKTWKDKVMAAVTAKRAEIKERIRREEERKNAKLLEKAEEKKELKVQTLMDLGKPKAAMIEAKKLLAFTPVKIEMPKIKDAVWKKTYIVTIEDIGALLTFIAKNPTYHNLVKQEDLVGRLETLARTLAGNMSEFKGIKCFESENHALGGGK